MSKTTERLAHLSLEEQRALLAQLWQKQTPKSKHAPLSFAQERWWFLAQLEPGNPLHQLAFNVALAAAEAWISGVVFLALYAAYIVIAARRGCENCEVEGPAECIAALAPAYRRLPSSGQKTTGKGLIISVVAGVLMVGLGTIFIAVLALVTVIFPEWRSTISLQIASPSPMPAGLVVKKASNMRS